MLLTVLLVVHVMLAVGLIALVLLQHGRGADMGAAFGSGASATVFGARGAASFLTRTTALLATGFFLTSMALAWLATRPAPRTDIMEGVGLPATEIAAPAAEATDAAPAVTVAPDAPPPASDQGAGISAPPPAAD
ncbi:MAG: preprotein translocase subunit SecG [Chromatiales bacterium]|nr:preprotein translocase subunit SecG [Chromatiales bacterium]